MPEYLAPAVYVEEVSFRAKPLEGVSTSTTAFVGPTATGPIDDMPELLTGVGDFERIYGGTSALGFSLVEDDAGRSINYLAHAVRAFFDNGGRRLYVARTFEAGGTDGIARTPGLVAADFTSAPNVRFAARFPGAAGRSQVQLREQRTLASSTNRTPLERAPLGTLIRVGTSAAATPAIAIGARPPFFIANGASVDVSVNGAAAVTVTFSGQSASVTSTTPLDFTTPFVVTADTQPIVADVNGIIQTLHIPLSGAGVTYDTLQRVADALNATVRGGFVRVSGDLLELGSEVRGTASRIRILEGGDFGFTDGAQDDQSLNPANNVPDLGAVTAEAVAARFAAAGLSGAVTVTVGLDQLLRISTVSTGTTATLSFADSGADPSAAASLGLALGAAPAGTGSTPVRLLVKRAAGYLDSLGVGLGAGDLNGVEIVSLNVVVVDAEGRTQNFEDLAYDPAHPRYIGKVLGAEPPRRSDALHNRVALDINADEAAADWAFTLRNALLGGAPEAVRTLVGGDDGVAPTQQRYTEAFQRLESIEDISIVAAPGSSARLDPTDARAIRNALISFVERRRSFQIAVLDSPPRQVLSQVREYRGDFDSKYAALYYPWVRIANPDQKPGDITIPREIDVPPSGFICGIYARNDAERGVFKAPANEVVRGALSFETLINFSQQEVLNPAGINALRFFPGRGYRVWGARLASSDPEWKYVSLRRYFNYVEASIDRGTQYVVFEPNGPRLWQRIKSSVSDFLFTEWRNGALLGNSPAEAFFVRVDRTTMTQNDLDNGRLIVEIGIAVVNPAEFVIFRIGQKTGDART